MGHYRKRPVIIEAQHWTGGVTNATPIIDWVLSLGGTARYHESNYVDDEFISINTLEGLMRAYAGWWIVKGVQGEFYSVRADVFDQTYEEVAE